MSRLTKIVRFSFGSEFSWVIGTSALQQVVQTVVMVRLAFNIIGFLQTRIFDVSGFGKLTGRVSL